MRATPDPLVELVAWYEQAVAAGCDQPDAMILATVDPQGSPSARVVLFRGVSGGGIRFFTNYESRKGRDLQANPRCAAVFFWPKLDRQIRLEGSAERLDPAESDAYFAARPRGHKLAAWASSQSQALDSREALLERWHELARQYEGRAVPRPPHWGGYRLALTAIEFWTGLPNRLHERMRMELGSTGWQVRNLQP